MGGGGGFCRCIKSRELGSSVLVIRPLRGGGGAERKRLLRVARSVEGNGQILMEFPGDKLVMKRNLHQAGSLGQRGARAEGRRGGGGSRPLRAQKVVGRRRRGCETRGKVGEKLSP